MKDLILIIDFMNYVHRGRVGDLSGEHVLTYNFFRSLRVTIEQFQPAKIFFALEGHPKHRYELYPEYKANRIIKTAAKQSSREQVITAANDIQKLLLLLPVTLVQHPDFEADDILNSLSFNLKDENVVIVSGDTDCIQILQKGYKNCRLYNPIKKQFIEPPNNHYLISKILLGDKSDNIPGILKPKKAAEVIENPEMLKDFLSIEENRAKFAVNRDLIEFKLIPFEELVWQEGLKDFNRLRSEFLQREFASIVNDYSWNIFTKTFDCVKY